MMKKGRCMTSTLISSSGNYMKQRLRSPPHLSSVEPALDDLDLSTNASTSGAGRVRRDCNGVRAQGGNITPDYSIVARHSVYPPPSLLARLILPMSPSSEAQVQLSSAQEKLCFGINTAVSCGHKRCALLTTSAASTSSERGTLRQRRLRGGNLFFRLSGHTSRAGAVRATAQPIPRPDL